MITSVIDLRVMMLRDHVLTWVLLRPPSHNPAAILALEISLSRAGNVNEGGVNLLLSSSPRRQAH